jgi:hypothetical protein
MTEKLWLGATAVVIGIAGWLCSSFWKDDENF